MENLKPVYNMSPEEITEANRTAIQRQQELLQKMAARRAETKPATPTAANDEQSLTITPLMRKEAELREQKFKAALPDEE